MSGERFRKKAVEVEAMHWDGSEASQAAIVNWSGGAVSGWVDRVYFLEVRTREGVMRANIGDWIIREPHPTDGRRYYPCKPDIFEATYEPVSSPQLNKEQRYREALETLRNGPDTLTQDGLRIVNAALLDAALKEETP